MFKYEACRAVTGPGLELLKRDVVQGKIHIQGGLPALYTIEAYRRAFLLGQFRVEVYNEKRRRVFTLFNKETGMYGAWFLDKNKKIVTAKRYKNMERCIC